MSQINEQKKKSRGPRYVKKQPVRFGKVLLGLVTLVAAVLSCWLTVQILLPVASGSGLGSTTGMTGGSGTGIMDRYDTYINNSLADALEGLEGFERPRKTYWLSDDVMVAPEPNPDCWGSTNDPASLQWLLDEAAQLLDVTDTLFSTETKIFEGSQVVYYLDETILSITWKQVVNNCVYTFSEVKIAHPSQFRRFLADGTYGSDKQYYPTDMAATVNAVTASSGDFYKFRNWGVSVYQSTVQSVKTNMDTCFIDANGDLQFFRAGAFQDVESAEAYVAENGVRFSLMFGPIMIEDGVNVVPNDYIVGEINGPYARMALCQWDTLHYIMVSGNEEGIYKKMLTTSHFADQLVALGITKAFALDGGQTATIIANDKLINRPTYGTQRQISDIIYFATAIPDGE